jgi:hypothetical protein
MYIVLSITDFPKKIGVRYQWKNVTRAKRIGYFSFLRIKIDIKRLASIGFSNERKL